MSKKEKNAEVKRRPGPMKLAEPTSKVWVPGIGEITVAEMIETAAKRKAEKKAKFVPEELMKEWLTELAQVEYVPGMKGTFTSGMYKEISAKLKEKLKRKVGVSKAVLKKEGYIDRSKAPGYKPFYYLTPKASSLVGTAPVPTEKEAISEAEKALEVLKK
jgi:hypothetical protein